MTRCALTETIVSRTLLAYTTHETWPTQPHHDDYVAAVTEGYMVGVYSHSSYLYGLTWAGRVMRDAILSERTRRAA